VRSARPLLYLALFWIAACMLVGRGGDFPLNDDWAYAHSVRWLLDEARIRLSDWIAMNLLPQTLLGGLAWMLFDESLLTLRYLTRVVALLAAWAVYGMLRSAGTNKEDALWATLAVMATPWWITLGNTFMTDLYGLALAAAASMLCLRWLQQPSRPLLAGIALLGAAAVLQRQVAFVVPLALVCAAWMSPRTKTKRLRIESLLPLVACVVAAWIYRRYLDQGAGVPHAQLYIEGRVLPLLLETLTFTDDMHLWSAALIVAMIALLATATAPWALCCASAHEAGARRWALRLAAAAAVYAAMLGFDWLPPFRDDGIVRRSGIGPYMIHDVARGLYALDESRGAFWSAVAALTAVGLIVGGERLLGVIAALARRFRTPDAATARDVFLIVVVVAYLAPFAVTDFFDRYLLFVLPFLFALLRVGGERATPRASAASRLSLAAGRASIVAMAAVSIAATHDYFAWNNARWAAIHDAERLGATPRSLDGGFEYNGFHNSRSDPHLRTPQKSWWWVEDDEWVVAFGPVPGYDTVDRYAVRAWLARTPREVLLLRRLSSRR
jgi:hypothetical protein